MKCWCPVCRQYDDAHIHCSACGEPIYYGEEVCKVCDKIYCRDCICIIELEEPERDWDFERKRRLEDAEL